ncbi:uncharacterized protein YyaL (SSP411 family) [Methanohalophilus levihalophilus]|uniref:thioredoxin domain-containing protein n=1 Tax=Methanohalophilus levihalophilus TaxID=1431282 RepID=UPI001AEB2610|nr:thioredoxin domain-containing protein [Methanohalophilus levihalophilus]MBP2030490.1 uncharacterized protein YyaL (SSP411 family) [Methanohalophilus levihalophilus]
MATQNRLAGESSPYLRQHANNPVDWYPWSDEAFEKALSLDIPVFLSIGYSSCHWCHVMAEESFEDKKVAALLNSHFISIKVDREERPDVDDFYMDACQAMTGRGGWPLTIIMTPERKPFYAATYLPKENRFGQLGVIDLLNKVTELWENQRDEIEEQAMSTLPDNRPKVKGALTPALFDQTYSMLLGTFDWRNGGFGPAPKFPSPSLLLFLLQYYEIMDSDRALELVEKTLSSMADGGIFDHLGGGFHRYSTDSEWDIPHFEKMLYDQAMLTISYLQAYQATETAEYKAVAEEVLAYSMSSLQHPEGAFYCAEDADVNGEEGIFYLWSVEEIEEILGKADTSLFFRHFKLVPVPGSQGPQSNALRKITGQNGNIESSAETIEQLAGMRQKLFEKRGLRDHPGLDDKVLADWNGMMIAALSIAARVCENDDYLKEAKRAADFVRENMFGEKGLTHNFHESGKSVEGFLDDYAFFAWGMTELYESTLDVTYLKTAVDLMEEAINRFWDEEEGGFFFTSSASHELPQRTKKVFDGAYPSGNSMCVYNLFRLFHITGNSRFRKYAEDTLLSFSDMILRSPPSYSFMITGFGMGIYGKHVVIVGEKGEEDAQKLLDTVQSGFRPVAVYMLKDQASSSILEEIAPYTKDMQKIEGKATAYVCHEGSCSPPVTDPAELERLLGE